MSRASDRGRWPDYENTVEGQFQAALPTQSAWVSANAGSGKTKVLIDRVARLLLKGVKPDAILCVTYTKAAASEMQARLFKRLGGWCVANDETLRTELAELERRDLADYADEEIGKARELFALALETPGGLRIETIHAFCGRLLRRFPLEAGAPPGFRELDDPASARLWRQAMAHLGAHALDDNLVAAVETAALAAGGNGLSGPLQALHGKQAAIAGFIRKSGGPDNAVAALRNALDAPLEDETTLIERGMGAQLPVGKLREVIGALFAGKATDVKTAEILEHVLSDAPADQRFKSYLSLIHTGAGELRKSNPFTAGTAKAAPLLADLFEIKSVPEGEETYRLKQLDAAVKARRIFERSAALLRLSDIAFTDYDRQKRRRAALDFDDLITSAAGLLDRNAAAEWVLWKLDGGLTHVLLDEAQDTSPQQWRLLNALTKDFFAGQGVERELDRTLFVVGDEKQSIYSFQGADPERFLSEKQDFTNRGAQWEAPTATPAMEMSFRSAPQVLDFVDTVFNADMFDGEAPFSIKPPEETDIVRHLPFRRDQPGCVELWPLTPPVEREEETPWDAPRGQQSEASPKAQLAARIARWAAQLIADKQAIWDGKTRRPARPGDILILVRGRTGGLFDAIIKSLKREGLPVAGADRIDLLDSLPVQDLLNLIRFALCPEDDLALAEILTGPFGGLSEDQHLFALAHGREGVTLWERVRNTTDADVLPIVAFLEGCIARRHWPAYAFLIHALEMPVRGDACGWDLIQIRLGTPAREPVTALTDRAAGFDTRGPSSLQMFLDAIETEGGEVKRELSGPQDEVRVMTVHGAKGLEAPIVIVPDTTSAPKVGVSNGLMVTDGDIAALPEPGIPVWAGSSKDDSPLTATLRQNAEARALRETRRLLYVALTRAQDRLLVCGAWSGGIKSKKGFSDRSWYDACWQAMSAQLDKGVAQSIETEDGPVLRFGEPQTADVETPLSQMKTTKAPAWLKTPAKREGSATRYAAPSSLLGVEPAVLAPFGPDKNRRLTRGRLIHTLLQTLPDAPRQDWRQRAADYLKRDREFDAKDHAEMVEVTLAVLEGAQFDPIFGPNSRPEVPIVGGNDAVLPAGMRINGRVDRLVVTPDEVKIIDFKTDRPAPARVEDVGDTYTAQMAAYRAVLQAAYPDRAIRCAIIWTDGPKLMEIPEASMDAALAALKADT